MSQVVLADEINRATPKTQSSLLECMEERQATIDGVTHPMPDPFLVIATQNPIEYEGTFALPEAQLDRFMLRIQLGYPALLDEIVILDEQKRAHPIEDLTDVCSVDELRDLQASVREIYVDPAVSDYIVRLVSSTRSHPDVYLGASPRGSIALYRAEPGARRAARPRLRDPGRRQGARRAGARPPRDHQDLLVDPRHQRGARGARARRVDTDRSRRRAQTGGPREVRPSPAAG